MHVRVAGDPAEYDNLPEPLHIQEWNDGVLEYHICQLDVCTIILMLGQTIRELTHVEHGKRLAIRGSVYPFCEVAKLPICQFYKRMRNSLDLGDVRHLHGQIFQLRKFTILRTFRFEDILAP